MKAGRPLSEYTGRNEKSKVVVKLHARNQGPPSRESALTEEDRAHLMLQAFRRQQELEVKRNAVTCVAAVEFMDDRVRPVPAEQNSAGRLKREGR